MTKRKRVSSLLPSCSPIGAVATLSAVTRSGWPGRLSTCGVVSGCRLERLRLVDWGAGERVRLRVPKDFRWRAGGPVKKAYGRRVMQEFLQARFDAPLELLRFESREMSAESAAVLRRRLERVVADFNELAELDAAAPAGRRSGMAMLVACRPWEFSVVNALKRRKGS